MPPDFLFFFILWLIFFRKPDIFFNVNGRRRQGDHAVRLGGVPEVQLDLRSDMAGLVLVDGRQKLHRLCHVPHRDRSRGGLRRETGKRQGDKETIIALLDFQQLKVDPTGNVFFTSLFATAIL